MKITIETTPQELAEFIFALVDAEIEINEGEDIQDDEDAD